MGQLSTKILFKDIPLVIVAVTAASISNILLKKASKDVFADLHLITEYKIWQFILDNFLVILGYSLYAVPTLITIILYKKYKVGYIQSLLSSIYVVTPLLALAFGIDNMNFIKFIGILVTFGGILYLLSDKE